MSNHFLIIILSVLTFLCPGHTYGQSAIDSLKKELKTARGLQRANLLLDLSSHTRQTDVEKAIAQVDEAQSIAQRLGNEKLEARSLSKLGFYHFIQNKSKKALGDYLQALQLNRQNGFRLQEAAVLHELGRFYDGQENYSKALEYYFQAIRIREEEGDKSGLARTLYYTGIVYDQRDEPEEAISFYQDAYALSKEIKNYRLMSMTAAGTAILYQKQDSLKQALSYYQDAMQAAKAINSSHAKATILLHMSSAYQDKKLFEKAVELNNQQIEIARAEKSKFLEAQGLENLANLYRDQGNLEYSNQYFREAKAIYEEIGYPTNPVIITNDLAQNLLQQGSLTQAIETAKQALTMAQTQGSLEESRNALELLVKAYTEQEAYQRAYETQRKLATVKDSIHNKEREKQIAQMQTRYETEQKEQEIALLQKKQEKAELIRNAFIGGFILIGIIGLLVYNRQRLKIKKNRTQLENTRLKEHRLKQDLEFKNKQLTTHSLNLVQKNEMMKELKQSINQIRQGPNGKIQKKLNNLEHLVDYSFNLDEDWEQFKLYFEEVHTGFFGSLKRQYSDLTPNELRLSALVKLNLTTKEIATIMGITPDSVKTARYRLRKKLDMATEENLADFMMSVERETQV